MPNDEMSNEMQTHQFVPEFAIVSLCFFHIDCLLSLILFSQLFFQQLSSQFRSLELIKSKHFIQQSDFLLCGKVNTGKMAKKKRAKKTHSRTNKDKLKDEKLEKRGIYDHEGKFNEKIYKDFSSTYFATEAVIREIKKNRKIKSIINTDFNHEFLYNEESHTAVLLKCVVSGRKDTFKKKGYKKTKNEFDEANRDTTVYCAKASILSFLNDQRFEKFQLAIPCGSQVHETCVFLRKKIDNFEAIYYNPNFSVKKDGVESSKTTNDLMKSFGERLVNIQSYYSPNGNIENNCSGWTWKEVFNHIYCGLTPFDNKNLKLEDYSHFTTPSSYERYTRKRDPEKVDPHSQIQKLIHYDVWENLDQLLHDTDASRLTTISRKLSQIVTEFFVNK